MQQINLNTNIVQDVFHQDAQNLCLLDINDNFYPATHRKELENMGLLRQVRDSMFQFRYDFNSPYSSVPNNVLAGIAVMQTADTPHKMFEFVKQPVYSKTGNTIVGRAISYNKQTGKYEATPAGWFNIGEFEIPFFNGRYYLEGLLSKGMFHFLNYLNQDYCHQRFMKGYER